eukprot:1148734-Pelagomonas_calceolata.AAC.3
MHPPHVPAHSPAGVPSLSIPLNHACMHAPSCQPAGRVPIGAQLRPAGVPDRTRHPHAGARCTQAHCARCPVACALHGARRSRQCSQGQAA